MQVFSGASNIASCGTNDDAIDCADSRRSARNGVCPRRQREPQRHCGELRQLLHANVGAPQGPHAPSSATHEYDVAGANAFYTYFKPTVGDSAKYYYSFDLGPYWHVVVLNNTPSVAYGAGLSPGTSG